jgi:hypothetical protein
MWYYNLNNQPAGPVDEAALKTLFARGAINFDTLVWREGAPSWVRLAETHIINQVVAAEAAVSPAGPAAAIPGRQSRPGLKTLFIWWLVTNCFFILFMFFNFGVNIFLPNAASNLSAVMIGVMCIFEMATITSQVLEYILLYKLWKNIQDGYASTTAGKAVGFMFIPFFNFYWFFRVYWGLAKDLNRYIDRHFPGQTEAGPRRSKEWISLTYLIFLFTGAVLMYVFMFGYMAVIMGSNSFNPYAAGTSSYFSAMMPFMIATLVYSIGQWGLMTAMFIDFYRTSDSILEAEEK